MDVLNLKVGWLLPGAPRHSWTTAVVALANSNSRGLHLPAAQGAHHGGVVRLVEALRGLALVVLAALRHGAAE